MLLHMKNIVRQLCFRTLQVPVYVRLFYSLQIFFYLAKLCELMH